MQYAVYGPVLKADISEGGKRMYMVFEGAGLIVGTHECEEKQLNNENSPADYQSEQD